MRRKRHARWCSIVGAAVVLGLFAPAGAMGASGTIVRAEASADWTRAHIAGAVYRTEPCIATPVPGPHPPWGDPPLPPAVNFPPCDWIPYATLGPATEDGCAAPGRGWPSGGGGIQVVWSWDEVAGVGSATFDLPAVVLEHGDEAPLLCLSVVEAVAMPIFCPAVVGHPCPPYAIVGRSFALDSALLEPLPSSSGQGVQPAWGQVAPAAVQAPQAASSPTRKGCGRGKKGRRKGGERCKWRKGVCGCGARRNKDTKR